MKALFSIIVTFTLAALVLMGSSGTFVGLNASRDVKVAVVPHDNEYLGFDCEDATPRSWRLTPTTGLTSTR